MDTLPAKSYEPCAPLQVAFIGLGVMGHPMAGHLARAGHHVTVFNRHPEKGRRWQATFGGALADSAAQAVHSADLVFSCVGNDDDLRQVTLGADGAFGAMKPGAVFVDHTTASVELARHLAEAAPRSGLQFIDAPVSGGHIGANAGQLTVMGGGDAVAWERARPVMAAYARATTLLGPSGSGQLAKLVNQICLAGLVQALCEGIAFGQRAGLDMTQVLAVLGQGAAQSWQMDRRGQAIVSGELGQGFAIDWLRKDLGLALAEARRNGAQLPVTALVDQFYADLQSQGGGQWDSASLIRRLRPCGPFPPSAHPQQETQP